MTYKCKRDECLLSAKATHVDNDKNVERTSDLVNNAMNNAEKYFDYTSRKSVELMAGERSKSETEYDKIF